MNSNHPPQSIETKRHVSGWAVLGFLYFFAASGIIMGTIFYLGGMELLLMKRVAVLVGLPILYPVLVSHLKPIAERKTYHVFFVGTGFAFLVTIIVFFGAMIWGAMQ